MHVNEPAATDQSNQQNHQINQEDFALEEIQGKGKMRKTKANFLNYLPQVP